MQERNQIRRCNLSDIEVLIIKETRNRDLSRMDPPRHKPAGGYHGHNLSDRDAFEDTRYYVHNDWPDLKTCAASLDVAEFVLEDWYTGKFKNRPFTDLLRKKIIEFAEKKELKKQETVVALPVASTGAATKSMMDPPSQKPAGGDATRVSEEVIYEDTKQWLTGLWDDEKKCVEELQVPEDKLKAWYKGDDKDPKFTQLLRSKIKMIKDARAVQKKQPSGVVPVATNPAVVPVATTGAATMLAGNTKQPQSRVKMSPVLKTVTNPAVNAVPPPASSVTTVSTGEQCTACRGKHDRHVCGKQKNSGQQMRSAPSVVANSGLQPRQPAVPKVVPFPRATLWKRVADLEGIVQSLTAELQLVKNQQTELLGDNKNLLNLAASVISLNAMLLPPLNNQPAPSQPMQEDSEDQRALKKMRTQ
jgi:hypothetical protein